MKKDKKNAPVEDCKICERAELSDDEMEQVSGGRESPSELLKTIEPPGKEERPYWTAP